MTYDPLTKIVDEPLNINPAIIEQLKALRSAPKLLDLPGVDLTSERERLLELLNNLLDILIREIENSPRKLWVMTKFQSILISVELEDTEAREHMGVEIENIMDIMGIESSDGLLSFYLGGF